MIQVTWCEHALLKANRKPIRNHQQGRWKRPWPDQNLSYPNQIE